MWPAAGSSTLPSRAVPAARRAAGVVHGRPATGRRCRGWGQRRRLAAGEGRRQADRVRRGPRAVRSYAAAGITGIRNCSSNPALALPSEVREYPNAISEAVTALRLAGVDGPYTLALSADAS